MDLAEHYLLDAADSYSRTSEPENRLTAILAEVLGTAPSLTSWLAQEAFRADPDTAGNWAAYGTYEIDWQVSLPGGERPDLEIRFNGQVSPGGRLFCENKITAPWTDLQRSGYPSVKGASRVLVISPDGRVPPHNRDDDPFIPVTWQALADRADLVGRKWATEESHAAGEWRAVAAGPEAPSEYRMLAELVHYLEQQKDAGVTVPGPLTDADLTILPRVSEVVGRWDELFKRITEELRERRDNAEEDIEAPWGAGGSEGRACTLSYAPGWDGVRWPALERLAPRPTGSWQEVVLSPRDVWRPVREFEPALGVGVGFHGVTAWPAELSEGSPFRAAIEQLGFDLGTTNRGKDFRVFATRSLTQILGEETSLAEQAANLARWAGKQLDALVRLELPGG